MDTRSTLSRRRTLAGLGIGATGLLAGCLGAPRSDTGAVGTPTPAPTPDAAQSLDVDRIAADPTDIPAPITRSEPADVEVSLEAIEHVAEVEPGVTFRYMTFGGQVPGPMIRLRRGDRVTLTLENATDSQLIHNVDSHGIYGPGGGAEHTTVAPGESATIAFTASYPGAFIYHCAVPNLDMHISAGMFGMMLVEPEAGMPEVDREFYLGQHEVYTPFATGAKGHHEFDMASMADEDPTYVLFNGEALGLTAGRRGAMQADRDETVRVFMVNGGPNLTSSFHPIGNVWTDLWAEGALASDPEHYVQTKPVAPGSCVVATMDLPVPGAIKLVDHALSRVARKGALAVVDVSGEPNTDVYDPGE